MPTYEDISNQSQPNSVLCARLKVAVSVWALSIGQLAADAPDRAKKATLAQTIVEDPTATANRLAMFVLIHQMQNEIEGDLNDAQLQQVADALLNVYAVQRPDGGT